MLSVVGDDEEEEEGDGYFWELLWLGLLLLVFLAIAAAIIAAIFSVLAWFCCRHNHDHLHNIENVTNLIINNSTCKLCTNIFNDMLPLEISLDASCWRFAEPLVYSGGGLGAITIVADDVDLAGDGYALRVEENKTGVIVAGIRTLIHDVNIDSVSGDQNFYTDSDGIVVIGAVQTTVRNVDIHHMQTALISFLSIDTIFENFLAFADASGGPGDAPSENRVVGGVRCIDSDRCVVRNGYISMLSDQFLVTLGVTSETFLMGRTRGFVVKSVTAFAGDIALAVIGAEGAYVGQASHFETKGNTNTPIACLIGDTFAPETSAEGCVLEDIVCKNTVQFGDAIFITNSRGSVLERVFGYQESEQAELTGALHIGFSQLGAEIGEKEATIVRNSYFESTLTSPNVIIEQQAGMVRLKDNIIQGGDNGIAVLSNFSTIEFNTIQGHKVNGVYVGNDFFNAGFANVVERNHISKSCDSAIKLGAGTQSNIVNDNRLTWNDADVTDLGVANVVSNNIVTPAADPIPCDGIIPVVGSLSSPSHTAVATAAKLHIMRHSIIALQQSTAQIAHSSPNFQNVK